MSLAELVKISNDYGANPDYVLAGGGNTSYKDAEYLYIKGSGTTLAAITPEGFVRMRREKLDDCMTREYPADAAEREAAVLADLMDARDKGEEGKRPSVETLLHELFPKRFVVHIHPALLNGLSCGADGAALCETLFGGRAAWLGIIEPGYVLAMAVRELMAQHRELHGAAPDIVILQNHGVFVAGDTAEEIDGHYEFLFGALESRLAAKPDFSDAEYDRERAVLLAPAIRMLLKEGASSCVVTFRTNREILRFVTDEAAFYPVSSAYTPDHIVYCRPWPLFVPHADDVDGQYRLLEDGLRAYKEKHGFNPKLVAVQGLGVYAYGTGKKQADICAEVFLDTVKIGVYSASFGGPRFMTDAMIDFIVNWEVEAYRSKISLAGGAGKRLEEKIVVVTGSAQGFGLGIAEEIGREGANVVLTDLNYELAKTRAEELEKAFGKGKYLAAPVDVSSEESVRGMIADCVLAYGGLDVFVSNAGVLKAGSVEEMDVKSFEFVTKINYTAYFICVKYASKIMKIQNRFAPDYRMDIIQINSKSGLSGSNKNFAYAGGKFGGVGLTQSFALELIPYGIKVNAICPGNLLGGPLWTDPEKGLFVQYLRAGKVPGAETIDDVRKFYEAKVPMNRGCEIIDVVRALLYAVEQQYETGQAIPVTGGQNMLK